MATFRRLTRSLSKSSDQQLETPVPATSSSRNKRIRKKEGQSDQPDDMDLELFCERQEAALNPAANFLPACFQSQPRPAPSSQLSDADLSFPCDLLQACDAAPTDFCWKLECDDSPPSTQLDMVSGMDQILESSSLLYSPVSSVAPPASPPSPQLTSPQLTSPQLTSAEELLHFYLPSPRPAPSPLTDDDTTHIADEDLLDDLESILGSFDGPEPDNSLSDITIGYNPPADTVALALSSQYEEGLYVHVEASQEETPAPTAVPAPSAGKGKGNGRKAPAAQAGARRGRKRKMSSDSDSAEERKRRQNAEAAKNYRKRKAQEMNKVFEEKEGVEKELEKVRKRLQAKLNERNILLKMLYESYKENDQPPQKIHFPPWIEAWYEKQKDD